MLFTKTFLVLSLIGVACANVLQLDKRAGACNADNCARLVTGTAANNQLPNFSSRSSDCSSFLSTTVIAPTSIATTTVTLTSGQRTPVQPVVTSGTASTIKPIKVPSYVSTSCGAGSTSTSRYSSACSCFLKTNTPSITTSYPTATTTIYTSSTPTIGCANVQGKSTDNNNPGTLSGSLSYDTSKPCGTVNGAYLVTSFLGFLGSTPLTLDTDYQSCYIPSGFVTEYTDNNGIELFTYGANYDLYWNGVGYRLSQQYFGSDPTTFDYSFTAVSDCS